MNSMDFLLASCVFLPLFLLTDVSKCSAVGVEFFKGCGCGCVNKSMDLIIALSVDKTFYEEYEALKSCSRNEDCNSTQFCCLDCQHHFNIFSENETHFASSEAGYGKCLSRYVCKLQQNADDHGSWLLEGLAIFVPCCVIVLFWRLCLRYKARKRSYSLVENGHNVGESLPNPISGPTSYRLLDLRIPPTNDPHTDIMETAVWMGNNHQGDPPVFSPSAPEMLADANLTIPQLHSATQMSHSPVPPSTEGLDFQDEWV